MRWSAMHLGALARSLIALLASLAWAVLPTTTYAALGVTECDKAASDPRDPRRKSAGVSLDKVGLGAIMACGIFVGMHPQEVRLGYLMGRANLGMRVYDEAATWMRKAADAGYPMAQFALGELYLAGQGVVKSDTQAFEWTRRSADAGLPIGMLETARMLEQGKGVAKNNAQALVYYRRAAAAGVGEAREAQTRLGGLQEAPKVAATKPATSPPAPAPKPAASTTARMPASAGATGPVLLLPGVLSKYVEVFIALVRQNADRGFGVLMTAEAQKAFEPVISTLDPGWRYLLGTSVQAVAYRAPSEAVVLFYNPWVDVALLTLWREGTQMPEIVDAELVTGDFVRRRGKPPFDIAPRWLRPGKDVPPMAVAHAVDDTIAAFSATFRPHSGPWRGALGALQNNEIIAANRIAAFGMLVNFAFQANRDYRTSADQAPLREALQDALQRIAAGDLRGVLESATDTPAATRSLLLDPRSGIGTGDFAWLSSLGNPTSGVVFLGRRTEPLHFYSFRFIGSGGKPRLARIDRVSYEAAALLRDAARTKGAGK